MSNNNLYTDFLKGEDIAIAGMDLGHTIKDERTAIEVTVVGKDRKGVVADITNFIFKNGGNIEQNNQNVLRGIFGLYL